jgi:hypothetical protein
MEPGGCFQMQAATLSEFQESEKPGPDLFCATSAGYICYTKPMNIDMTDSFWQGDTIRLRATEASDWEVFFAWNQDDEMARTLYFIPFPQSQRR